MSAPNLRVAELPVSAGSVATMQVVKSAITRPTLLAQRGGRTCADRLHDKPVKAQTNSTARRSPALLPALTR